MSDERPALDRGISGAELQRWYWRKDELAGFARQLGVRATGGKDLLTRRIVAFLDGVEFAEPAPRHSSGSAQLSGCLGPETVIPRGQRCSQVLRAWFSERLGSAFHFDAEMRAFFVGTDGTQTLQDALDHWRATRGQGAQSIGEQFEFNRFTRAWHETHPGGPREELLAAWRDYRARPVEERGRI
ncbi:DUF6434 domain-containing protein [Nocardioides pantholopis]|uniref:DUF6434 domain-containing protein n=1 Tax=Nocardioides pantholopis TaxID=2483798 RepID=UPI0019D19826|nr:DUF6434 domain-containing protein [Nocardioides pantholopis]